MTEPKTRFVLTIDSEAGQETTYMPAESMKGALLWLAAEASLGSRIHGPLPDGITRLTVEAPKVTCHRCLRLVAVEQAAPTASDDWSESHWTCAHCLGHIS